ncbi:helix-turn-helix domain-containing protein [Azospirillum canadense]|uniref:helix-turn-helix domain-containing protein n=1 Tax=Azospirillum canadense TaxID=403962 RepID=UPI002227F923|nr:helix-turn-helix transcriptional regulator [Azospirillum canadense]MCW2242256.1 hypothetical protein [Azospirillum canadense]
MSADTDYVTVGDPMPVIASLRHLGDHTVLVTWAEGPRAGREETVDLGNAVHHFREFAPLMDSGFFATGSLIDNGNVIRWDTSRGPIEMPATLVEHYAIMATYDHWSAERFRAWMERHGLSLDRAADELGIGRRLVAYYRSGDKEIPRTIALACAGYDAATHQHAA